MQPPQWCDRGDSNALVRCSDNVNVPLVILIQPLTCVSVTIMGWLPLQSAASMLYQNIVDII